MLSIDLWYLILGRCPRPSSFWFCCGKLCFLFAHLYFIFNIWIEYVYVLGEPFCGADTGLYTPLENILVLFFWLFSYVLFSKVLVICILASRICLSCLLFSVTNFHFSLWVLGEFFHFSNLIFVQQAFCCSLYSSSFYMKQYYEKKLTANNVSWSHTVPSSRLIASFSQILCLVESGIFSKYWDW